LKDHRFYNCYYSQIEDATDNLNGSDACNTFCSIRVNPNPNPDGFTIVAGKKKKYNANQKS